MAHAAAPPHERLVVLVAYDGIQLLDLAGPVEVLRLARLLGASPPPATIVATPGGRRVRSDSGIEIGADVDLAELAASDRPVDTVVVVGGLGVDAFVELPGVVDDLALLAARARRVTSVCTGAVALAAAGLLDGRRATTHWADCDRLAARYPAVTVDPDPIFVRDGHVWTSAGVTAGIDLTLALVEDDHGPELAHAVAGWLVVFVRRPGGQSQFSAQLAGQAARSPAIAEVQRWLPDHLADDCTVEALARRAGMSPRHFARSFRAEVGATPASYVEALRTEAARRLLETTDLTVAAIARAVGLRHGETLHRAFRRRVGTTPERYRQHFARGAA